MKPLIHATAGAMAMLCAPSFWTSTAIAELCLSHPAMAITGGSGFSLAGRLRCARP